MTSGRLSKVKVQRYTAEQLRTMPGPVLQTLNACLARRRLDLMGIHWRTHLYISWPPGGDLEIYYA